MSTSNALKHYQSLSMTERQFCQACALLFSRAFYQADYVPYLRVLGVRSAEGKALTGSDIRELLDKCRAINLLDPYWRIRQDLQHPLVLEALKNPDLKERVLQVYGLLPGSSQYLLKDRGRSQHEHEEYPLLCLQIYLSASYDPQAINDLMKNLLFHHVISNHFSNTDMDWIKTLPMKIQLAIFEAKLQYLWRSHTITSGLQEAMETYFPLASKPGYPEVASLLIRHSLCTADLRPLSESIISLLNVEDDTSLLTLASIRFLQGDFALAKQLFEQGVKLTKARLKTTKYFPNIIQGCYYAFTLLTQQEDPKCLTTLLQGIEYIHKSTDFYFFPIFMQLRELVFYLSDGTKTTNLPHESNCPMAQAFSLLITYWMDRPAIQRNLAIHQTQFETYKNYFPGMARIFAEVLSKVCPHSAPYLDYLEQTRALYPISFLHIVSVKEPWDNSLNLLERLCTTKNGETPAASIRLLWRIDLESSKISGVCEQKISAKGVWSKGRPIALERLKQVDNFNYFTQQELQAVSSIESYTESTLYSYHPKTLYTFLPKVLSTLVGHPNLVDDRSDVPLELTKGEVALLVKSEGDHYSISLSPLCQKEGIRLEKQTDSCYKVIEIGKEEVLLQTAIGPENSLRIPKSAKGRLQAILKAIGNRLPVQSELQYETVRKEGDSTISARLVPQQHGLKLNLCVLPFGAEGPHFSPGKGFNTPQALIKGKQKKVLRNLNLERQLADQLIQAIEPLKAEDQGQDEWFFEQPEDVLNLLESLQNYSQPLNLIWPEGKKLSVTPTLSSKSLSLTVKSDLDWFSLEGELKINQDQVVEFKQLLELIDTSPSRFVALSETQFLVLTDQFKRQLREIKALAEKQRGKYTFHRLSSLAMNDFVDGLGNFAGDEKWHQMKERMLSAQKHSPAVPTTLHTELRPYQMEGFQWLSRMANWGMGACLADDMGLGKTIQALALILEHTDKGATIVVAPTSVCYNWIHECSRFSPGLKVILHAKERKEETLKALGPGQLLITSYGLLHQDIELLSTISWQTIVLDEAQVIKNANTKRSQAAHQLRGNIKLILTGTPIENRLSELWNLFRFINPGLLGSSESFSKRFVEPIEQHKDVEARRALKKIIMPFVLRRLKSQVLTDLPPRIEQTILVPFDAEEQAFYEALRQNALEKLIRLPSQDKKRIHILAEITRLRRACCHPTLVAPEINISSSKLKAAERIIEDLRENRHRALIFSQFVGHLEKVKALLEEKGISYQYLDGSTSIDERQKRVAAFQNGQGDFFLISLRAGGTGLNLTAADYVIHMDPWWNPAVEDQASDRAHRIGQTRPVTIYRLIMEGSIEEKMVVQLHQDKRGLVNDLLDGTDLSGKLTDEELLALL